MFEKIIRQSRCDVEVFYSSGREIEVELDSARIKGSHETRLRGYGVRVVAGGFEGFSSTTSEKDLVKCLRRAEEIAELKIKSGIRLPAPRKYSRPDTCDERIAGLGLEDCIQLADSLVDCEQPRDAFIAEASVGVSSGVTVIENSHGVSVEEKDTLLSCFAKTVAGGNVSGFEHNASTRLDYSPADVGVSALKIAVDSLDPVKISPGEYDLVLGPYAVSDLLSTLLVPAVNGDVVYRGKSKLASKVGSKVASEVLTIVDDGTLDHHLGSCAVDGEGTPTQKTEVITEGVLQNFLYDIKTADKAGTDSTGNAARSHSSTPSIGPTNFIVGEGGCSRDELVRDTRRGLLVHHLIGTHTSNPVSGDFAVELENTFTIGDGGVGKCIRNGILVGNLYDLLDKITALADDSRQIGSVKTPSIKVSGMDIVV